MTDFERALLIIAFEQWKLLVSINAAHYQNSHEAEELARIRLRHSFRGMPHVLEALDLRS